MGKVEVFDNRGTQEFTKARQLFLAGFLERVRQQVSLSSAVDIGCGVGDFSKLLSELGFRVVGVDGRGENIAEAKKRYPGINFVTGNAEDLVTSQMGSFDLVLCFGLLYHLENPFRAIRNLRSLTGQVLLIESMCAPTKRPTMELLDESVAENQGLRYVAFYPSESCLAKMLYRSGFPFVYSFSQLPSHELYNSTIWKKRRRTVLAASTSELRAPNLVFVNEPFQWATSESELWGTRLSRFRDPLLRLGRPVASLAARVPRFLNRPWNEKREILFWYMKRVWRRD